MCTIVVITPTALHGADAKPVLFYNDRAWTISRLPAELVHSIYYVPISFLVQLPDVQVRVNDALQTFIITYGDKYLSFDITTDFAVNQDKERMYLKTAEYHSERYVPVRTVCAYLGLGYAQITNPLTDAVALRVTDGNQEYGFNELVKMKYPSLFPDSLTTETTPPVTTAPPQTTPPDTSDPKPVLSERTIYITIENSPGDYTKAILKVLRDYKVKATFFVVGDEMADNAALLSEIAAGGHEIALHTMRHDSAALTDADSIISDIEAQNELLYRLIKQKSHIWRAPDGSDKLPVLTSAVRSQLFDMGYIVWDANVNIPTNLRSAQAAANVAINGIWSNETAILRFEENWYTAAALRLVLDFINDNRNSCDIRTISPAFDEYSLVSYD